MEAIAAVVQLLPHVAGLLALAVTLYAGYDLAVGPDWRRHLSSTAARVWVFAALGLVAVEDLIFDRNVVLVAAYQLGAPLGVVQAGFLGSLAAAVLVWMRD